jgi:hypothetical protein
MTVCRGHALLLHPVILDSDKRVHKILVAYANFRALKCVYDLEMEIFVDPNAMILFVLSIHSVHSFPFDRKGFIFWTLTLAPYFFDAIRLVDVVVIVIAQLR